MPKPWWGTMTGLFVIFFAKTDAAIKTCLTAGT
jgi:hypothetical protein